jgi:LysR family transcriptional regulator, glycine cleavage system transcriptional activator
MPKNESRLPSLDLMRAFEVAARLGSFDRAADELAITASALSKRITSLESLIGTPVFDRKGRSVTLTASGKEYAMQVRSILSQLESIGLHARKVQNSQRLRVLAPPTFAREILIPQLNTFTTEHSDVDLEIIVAIPYLDRSAPDADITVGFGPRSAGEPLLFEPVFAVAAPGFAKRYAIKTPLDLVRTKAPTPRVRCPLELWAPWFSAINIASLEPQVGLKVVDLGLMLESAAQGHGAALARASVAAKWLKSGELIPLFPDVSVPPNEGYLLSVQRAHAPALAFARWLRIVCKKLESNSRRT